MEEFEQGKLPATIEHPWQTLDWTTEEIQFVPEYLRHHHGARAWRSALNRADASPPVASKGASIILERPHIAAYIKHCQAEMLDRLKISKERILEELAKLAYANMADFVVIQEDGTAVTDLSGLTAEQFAAISECTIDTYVEGRGDDAQTVKSVKIKLAPKLGALDLLGRSMKLFTDVVESGGVAGVEDRLREARAAKRRKRQGDDDAG